VGKAAWRTTGSLREKWGGGKANVNVDTWNRASITQEAKKPNSRKEGQMAKGPMKERKEKLPKRFWGTLKVANQKKGGPGGV